MAGVLYLVYNWLHMKNIHDVADKEGFDPTTRMAFIKFVSSLNERTRRYIEACYMDQELASIYKAMREENRLGGKSKNQRAVIRFPNRIIYQFLDDVFTPIYGPEWLTDLKILKKVVMSEDLIKPWVIGKI